MPAPDDNLVKEALVALNNPVSYGFIGGSVRFLIGNQGSTWRAFAANIIFSVFVSVVLWLYLDAEGYAEAKRIAFCLLAALAGKDGVIAFLAVSSSLSKDPFGFWPRVKAALRGDKTDGSAK